MLEHFSDAVPPSNALRGQMWFDTTGGKLNVNTSNVFGSPEWVAVGSAIVSATEPTTGFEAGTFWFDTVTSTLNVSPDGSTFEPIRSTSVGATPPGSPQEGDLFYDTTTKELKVFNGGLSAFDVVGPARNSAVEPSSGLQDGDEWWNSATKQLFAYDADLAEFRLVGPLAPAGGSSVDAEIVPDLIDGNSVIKIVIGGDIVGIWSKVQFTPGSLIANFHDAIITDIERGLNLAPKAGPSSETTLLQGTATESLYADIAERFATDGPLESGDVVKLGGEAEITKTTKDADLNVFGIVSTDPAFKMNAGAGTDETHPYIAMTGRVPCKVIGVVKIGDRLVSSDTPGVARAISVEIMENMDVSSFAIIGRSLENSLDETVKLIDTVVGTK